MTPSELKDLLHEYSEGHPMDRDKKYSCGILVFGGGTISSMSERGRSTNAKEETGLCGKTFVGFRTRN